MELTARDIARITGGELTGDPDQKVTGIAGVREAQAGDVSFVASPKYFAAAGDSRASLLIIAAGAAVSFAGPTVSVADPTAAFERLVEAVSLPPITFPPGVSERAVVHPSARLGTNVSVQPFVVIEEGVSIGDRTVIGAGSYIGHGSVIGCDVVCHAAVTLRERTVLGDRVILHGGVVLGADGFGYEFKNGRHEKVPQRGTVEVGDDVEIGANSAIDRGRFGTTRIGRGTKIDNLVQIGHNCIIGEHCVICGLVGMAGSTLVGNYVTIAGQVGIAGHLTIGDKSILMAKAGVTKDVPPSSLMLGAPAVPHKQFKQVNAEMQRLPQTADRLREVERLLREFQEQVVKAD